MSHHFFIVPRCERGFGFIGGRTHSTKQVDIVKPLLSDCSGASTRFGPQPCSCVFLTKACFIVTPNIHAIQCYMARDRKVRYNYEFLKYSYVSWDSSVLFKRLVTHEKPNSCKGRHAVVIINGPGWRAPAGWHQALLVEDISNVSILKLPQYPPELKPEEQVWSWLRRHHLAVRCLVDQCFSGCDGIVESCSIAWIDFVSDTKRVSKTCSRDWLEVSKT
jgi:transposase